MRPAIMLTVVCSLCAEPVVAQQGSDALVATATEWGGEGGVYTCDQWRAYLTRIYRIGDKRRRGFIDAQDFEAIKRASVVFTAASFDYFDVAGSGRVSKAAFLASPNPIFARYDKNHSCRVTAEDLRRVGASAGEAVPQRSGRHGGSGRMRGFGGR